MSRDHYPDSGLQSSLPISESLEKMPWLEGSCIKGGHTHLHENCYDKYKNKYHPHLKYASFKNMTSGNTTSTAVPKTCLLFLCQQSQGVCMTKTGQ